MINSGENRYEVVLDDKWFLGELTKKITLEESLDEIAYRARIEIVVPSDFPGITPGQEIRVSGTPFGESQMAYLLHPGVVWECDSTDHGQKHLTITAFDKTIYLAKSEDEYLFPAGQTASQRLKRYAANWDVKVGNIPDTGVPLAKAVYRPQTIYQMIMADLRETVKKGGKMYRPRMTPNGLELLELGSNATAWVLEADRNIENIRQNRTLQGAVTQVKVLGREEAEKKAPVLAMFAGEINRYGTLQKVLQDEKIKTAGQAQTAGKMLLAGMQETFMVQALDINTIHAGDKVLLNGMELLVTSVSHELGSPGRMNLELASQEHVRRKYYVQ